jgi:hypothetical protein
MAVEFCPPSNMALICLCEGSYFIDFLASGVEISLEIASCLHLHTPVPFEVHSNIKPTECQQVTY